MLTQKHFLLCISLLFLIIFYYVFQQFQRESKNRRASLSEILEKALTEPVFFKKNRVFREPILSMLLLYETLSGNCSDLLRSAVQYY